MSANEFEESIERMRARAAELRSSRSRRARAAAEVIAQSAEAAAMSRSASVENQVAGCGGR